MEVVRNINNVVVNNTRDPSNIRKGTCLFLGRNIIEFIRKNILKTKEVLSDDLIKSRLFVYKLYIDIEITLNKELSFMRSYQIAHELHDVLETSCNIIKDCTVHVNTSL